MITMAEETEKTTDTALSFTLENLAGYAPVQINNFVSRLVKELVLKDSDHVGQIIQGGRSMIQKLLISGNLTSSISRGLIRI